MEYRPNSRPERTGPYMTGLIRDSEDPVTSPRSVEIGPDGNRLERIISNRAKSLDEDRETLTQRLERYTKNRAINHWLPPKHPSYNLIAARLKSFDKMA
jgi:hypothetical protein